MLRVLAFLAALALTIAAPNPANIFEIDITPEEAQQYLNSPPFTQPQLSGRTAVLPLVRWNDPRFRTAEAGPTLGHYWKNGKEIEDTDAYLEEVYDAAQYHGQDGLGAYAYGYETPESSKVENRVRSGDVQGSYIYRTGNNELIKVRYWADSQGFHQEDNLPKVVLQPAQETEEVRQARLAHEKAWIEAANGAALQPDPQGAYYDKYNNEASASEPEESVVAPPSPSSQAREGKAYVSAQAQSNFQTAPQRQPPNLEEAEPTGPPRGFFYSYNYPVSIIVPKSELQQGSNAQPIDYGTQS